MVVLVVHCCLNFRVLCEIYLYTVGIMLGQMFLERIVQKCCMFYNLYLGNKDTEVTAKNHRLERRQNNKKK